MDTILIVLTMTGILTIDTGWNSHACEVVAKQLRVDPHVSTAFCLESDQDEPDPDGHPTIKKD